MTPAEFTVLADSRIKHYRDNIDVMDALNALNCHITLGNSDVKLSDLRMFTQNESIEQPAADTVSVFKQWVTATGGETI